MILKHNKIITFLIIIIISNSCMFFEEEHTHLISNIDGIEYNNILEGEMNTYKASLYIIEGKEDSVDYKIKLDIVDSLETLDSIWRKKYITSVNKVIEDVYNGNDKTFIENKMFSLFIHYPNDIVKFLDRDGFSNIELWMKIIGKGLNEAIRPEDITINSVINVAISNCKNCDRKKQKLIEEFVYNLEQFSIE